MCYITLEYWLLPMDQKPMAVLSTNSKEMITNGQGKRSVCRVLSTDTPLSVTRSVKNEWTAHNKVHTLINDV